MHLTLLDSSKMQLSVLHIQAPEDSPNNDGIHKQRVQNAQIDNCVIETAWKLLISLLYINMFIHINPFNIDAIA